MRTKLRLGSVPTDQLGHFPVTIANGPRLPRNGNRIATKLPLVFKMQMRLSNLRITY